MLMNTADWQRYWVAEHAPDARCNKGSLSGEGAGTATGIARFVPSKFAAP